MEGTPNKPAYTKFLFDTLPTFLKDLALQIRMSIIKKKQTRYSR